MNKAFTRESDRDDDDGVEKYVRDCVDTRNVEWFPKARAMRLKEAFEPPR